MSKDKKKSETGDETALSEWEAKGGSLISEPQRLKHIQLGEREQYVLYCLGGAVLMQWNELPNNIQRVLFERAALPVSPAKPHSDPARLKVLALAPPTAKRAATNKKRTVWSFSNESIRTRRWLLLDYHWFA